MTRTEPRSVFKCSVNPSAVGSTPLRSVATCAAVPVIVVGEATRFSAGGGLVGETKGFAKLFGPAQTNAGDSSASSSVHGMIRAKLHRAPVHACRGAGCSFFSSNEVLMIRQSFAALRKRYA